MKIAITGSSGLVGNALRAALEHDGHRVFRLVRGRPGNDREIAWDPAKGSIDRALVARIAPDAVIHLAGDNIASGRWTAAKKERLRESRVASTRLIAETIASLDPKPSAFVSASAIGFYGDRGDEVLDEGSAIGEGFLAALCRDWEAETRYAHRAGIRTSQLRFGVILSRRGGALARMLLPFRLGIAGRLGTGRQWMSPVSLDDAVAAIRLALTNESLAGPVNVTIPEPVTNAEFTRALARALHRPAILPFPAFALRVLFGEMGETLLLSGQRVLPNRLHQAGFTFRSPTIGAALESALAH